MTRTFAISSLVLLGTLAATPLAHAESEWVHSPSQFIPYNCAGQGLVNGIETWIGYEDDVANRLKTGDSRYIHAVAKNVGCTLDGVTMEIFLPAGAIRDTSKSAYCIRQHLNGTSDPITNCAPWGFVGPNGGLAFTTGTVNLDPSEYLEIQIPVIYNAELVGAAGGLSHALGVKTMSTTAYALPSTPVTVGYRTKFENLVTNNIGLTSARLNVNLFTFFKGGQLSFDYGTTIAFGQTTTAAPMQAGYVNYPNAYAVLPNLAPATTYHWQARYVTASGTFVSARQSFATAAPILTVGTTGRGLGKITSNPNGIDCGASSANVCAVNTAPGITITLYAQPSLYAYTFTGWSGACTGTGPCTVTMNDSKSVTANFEYFTGTPIPLPPGPTSRR